MPRGGARVGSGRKGHDEAVAWLGGDAGKRGNATAERPKAPPVRLLPAPAGLSEAEAEVWNELAPHACGARTLVEASARSFTDLCENIVLKREMDKAIKADGLTFLKVTVDGAGQEHREVKAHPLLSQYRGILQRVEAAFQRFKLTPMGKPMEVAEETAVDPFAEFDEGPVQ